MYYQTKTKTIMCLKEKFDETCENNILIMQFHKDIEPDVNYPKYIANTFKFHKSWDWLMPVIKQIVPPNGWQSDGIALQTKVLTSLQSCDIDKC
ncbi:MAG: hypothetical protein ACOC4L_03665 [Halanaerobium sp.]